LPRAKSRIRGFAPGRWDADTQTMSEMGNSTTAADRDEVTADIDPIDVQRLLTWYFDVVHPGRHHITSRDPHPQIVV
jgi:hypothetical protein